MKTLITLLLFTTIVNAQKTNFHFYWGSNEALGAEIIINESFGFGFSGTTEKDKALFKPIVKGIAFDKIPEGIKQFWINFKNENNGK